MHIQACRVPWMCPGQAAAGCPAYRPNPPQARDVHSNPRGWQPVPGTKAAVRKRLLQTVQARSPDVSGDVVQQPEEAVDGGAVGVAVGDAAL